MYIEYKKEYHPLGQNIQLLRKKYALSRRSLAKLLDISECQLKQIESGDPPCVVDSRLLRRLYSIFGISADTDLFSTHCI